MIGTSTCTSRYNLYCVDVYRTPDPRPTVKQRDTCTRKGVSCYYILPMGHAVASFMEIGAIVKGSDYKTNQLYKWKTRTKHWKLPDVDILQQLIGYHGCNS